MLDFQFPKGAIKYSKSTGDRLGVTVHVAIEWRIIGTEPWNAHPNFVASGKQTSVKYVSTRIDFPARGQYEVRARRITADTTTEQDFDELWWSQLKSYTYETPIRKKGLCLTALRIQASEQLSGQLQTVNGLARSIGWVWDAEAGEWAEQPTRSPAALFRLILQGNGQKKPLDDGKLDFDALESWAAYADSKGCTCDFVFDKAGSTWEALKLVAATGFAAPAAATGVWSVVVDRERDFPVQWFGPRDMTKGSFSGRRLFTEIPHALRVRFVDESQNYAQDTRVVYNDGYDENNASLFEDMELPGVTNADQLYRIARRRIAEAKLRPETFFFETDLQWLVCTRGDRIQIATDIAVIGLARGRVLHIGVNEQGFLWNLTLDETITLQPGRTYGARIRSVEGDFHFQLVNKNDTSRVIELAHPVPLPAVLAVGDMVFVGEFARETFDVLVKEISPGTDGKAKLTCIPYSPGVYTADTEVIPDWDSGTSDTIGATVPRIVALRSGETAGKRNADGTLLVMVVVTLFNDGTRPLTMLRGIDIRWREAGENPSEWIYLSFPPETNEVHLVDVEDGLAIEVGARYVFNSGVSGDWSPSDTHLVDGPDIPPPDITSIYLDGDGIAWSLANPPPDLAGFYVRYGTKENLPWNVATPLFEGLLTTSTLPGAELPTDCKEVLVKAVTTAGLESVNATRLKVNPAQFLQRLVWYEQDLATLGWPGTITGGIINGPIIEAQDTSVWLQPRNALWLSPKTGTWLDVSWDTLSYEFDFTIPSGVYANDKVWLDLVADGPVNIARRFSGDAQAIDPGTPVTQEAPFEGNLFDPGDEIFEASGTPENAIYEVGLFEAGTYVLGQFSAVSERPWLLWKQSLRAVAGETITFRIQSAVTDGSIRTRLRKVRVIVDAEEIEETQTVSIPDTGIRLTLAKQYRGLKYIVGTLIQTGQGSAATSLVIDDLSLATGPILHAINGAGANVSAQAVLRIGGY